MKFERKKFLVHFCLIVGFLFILGATCLQSSEAVSERDRINGRRVDVQSAGNDGAHKKPIYRIPLRVHIGKSGRASEEWGVILEEINSIWLTQAGICFEIHTVNHDEILQEGFDIWFSPGREEVLNGYFVDKNEIWVKDTPNLRPAPNPAKYPAARTASHELGHALHLIHREDSNDNLMRSQTLGWQLNEDEVRVARTHGAKVALPDTGAQECDYPQINP